MFDERNFEIKVGLFVMTGVVIAFFLIFSIGDINFVEEGRPMNIVFDHIDGISKSSPLQYAGLGIGYVKDVNVYYDEAAKRNRVNVTAWVTDPSVQIEKDAKVTINTLGLLGEKYIEIFPGNRENGILEQNGTIVGKNPIMMSDVTDNLNELAGSAKAVVNKLKDGEGTIGKLLVKERIYDDLEDFVADIKANPWKLFHKPADAKSASSANRTQRKK